MDDMFLKYFKELVIDRPLTQLHDIINQTLIFHHPCVNFGKDFLIKLFLRFRIYHTLKSWNRELHEKNKRLGVKTPQKLLNVQSL